MKRSNVALALILAGAVTCGLGCGEGSQKAGASAEPAKSGAAATTGTGKSSAAAAKTGDEPATTGKTPDAPAKAAADVLKHMPKECDEGRVFVSLGKLFAGDVGTSIESLAGSLMAMGKDAKKGEAVMKALKDGGVEPMKDIREIAVCANKDDKKTVVATYFESKSQNPADAFAKAIEAGAGKAPTKEEKDGVTWIKGDKDMIMAVVGKNIVLMGEDQAAIEAAVKGGDGGGEFGDSRSHVVWAKVKENDTQVMLKEAGSDYDLKVVMNDKNAAKTKEKFDKMLLELDKAAEQMPAVKPLLPVAKNGKMEVAGEALTFTTKFPKAALGDFLKEAGKQKPEELMKGLKF